ncbi:secretin N-terminal domain-containing protein [Burkholderia sp. Ac-20365]|uniref:secretin N-terminal domain-containing protein n=1 Tax=Burkholderia sp. Ac-20365 TaxID=2703897 RepID=UPI00197B8427|nr:secretin N-terminal domain-containing protein [Burkholderia sp. Ac-20365]MBN3761066.1 pilus assembly protein PilN [Burkholderia sp. Ac-20365]
MKLDFKKLIATVVAVASIATITGCAIPDVQRQQAALAATAQANAENGPLSRPVVQIHDGAWLLGEKIKASKAQPEIFDRDVYFSWTKSGSPTLSDIAQWIVETQHVRSSIDSSVTAGTSASSGAATAPLTGSLVARAGGPLPLPGMVPAVASATPSGAGAIPVATARGPVKYTGKFRGFLDIVDASFNVWSRYQDGTVSFFRTETRTFAIPTLPDTSSMTGSISTGEGNSSSSSGSENGGLTSGTQSLTPTTGAGSSSGNSGSGGQTIRLGIHVSPWEKLEASAKAVAGGDALVHADPNLNMLTVTGTPPQCDRIEDWVKSLNAQYGKQVAIDVHVYQVQRTQEDNYGLNLQLAYESSNGHTGIKFSGAAAPTVTSSSSPMSFGATILGGTLAGSSAAVQALSTLGNVSQVVARSGVTQNGKVLALQAARSQGYVASTQTTLATSVGSSTSMQTATLVPGFTSSFLPKIVNGRVLIDFDMTLSDLVNLVTFTSGSGSNQSSVQLPTLQVTRFEQSVSLKPGETLVLTGMRQQSASTTNNGVGSAYNPLLGGGMDAQKGDTIIAVVITARLL